MTDKPLILDSSAVQALLPQLDTKTALHDLFAALGNGQAVQPPQTVTVFPDSRGDFITYLGALAYADVFGTKMSPYIMGAGKPIITAWTCLMSMATGQPAVWCDAGVLTTERTAGTTAIAVDQLAPKNATKLAIIGAGAVAQAHYRHVADLRDWERVRVYSPSLAGNSARCAQWQSLREDVIFSDAAKVAVQDADVVMLCTSSGTPVIDPKDIGKPALITSISTNVPRAHEVPPPFLNDADVYCDYAQTTPASAGEMCIAAEDHGWTVGSLRGDLPGLICGTCPKPEYERHVFFRSIGLGLEDIAMAHGIWKLAKK